MAINKIAMILKQERSLNDLTPDQVVSMLSDRGFSISTKALYAYEAGTNYPKVPVFLALCDIYNIRDIMGSFGYKTSLCTGDDEWEPDQYEDFFKASLYEKIYLLAKWGIPSFEDYETLMTQPTQIVLSDDEIQLLKMYRSITPEAKDIVRGALESAYNCCGEEAVPSAKNA